MATLDPAHQTHAEEQGLRSPGRQQDAGGPRLQLKREVAELGPEEQSATLRPPMPLMMNGAGGGFGAAFKGEGKDGGFGGGGGGAGTAVQMSRDDEDHDHDHDHEEVAPAATLRPQIEMIIELSRELYWFKCAEVVLGSVVNGQVASFVAGDLSEEALGDAFQELWVLWDEDLRTRLYNETRDKEGNKTRETMDGARAPDYDFAQSLQGALELLVHHGLLLETGEEGGGVGYEVQGAELPGSVVVWRQEIEGLRDGMITKTVKGNPTNATVPTRMLPKEWSSSNSAQDEEELEDANLAELEGRLEERVLVVQEPKGKERVISRVTGEPELMGEEGGVKRWKVQVAEGVKEYTKAKEKKDRQDILGSKDDEVEFEGEIVANEPTSTGTHPLVVERRRELEVAIEAQKEEVLTSQRYRTFAAEVMDFLEVLRGHNDRWKAGTYIGHSWGEFSIDVYLSDKDEEFDRAFFDPDAALAFAEALNTTAIDVDGALGRAFSWRVIYGDKRVGEEIEERYGEDHYAWVAQHGPAREVAVSVDELKERGLLKKDYGDRVKVEGWPGKYDVEERGGERVAVLAKKQGKLHLHLDIRPVEPPRRQAGYDVVDGRIVLNKEMGDYADGAAGEAVP